MTRIGADIPAPNNTSASEIAAHVGNATSEVTSAAATDRAAAADNGVDRPARQLGDAPTRTAIDVATFRHELLGWEGNKPFMYVDTRGYVTTGIGNKLSSGEEAMKLPWRHKATGLPATPAEIRTAFEHVQAKYAEFRLAHPDGNKSAGADHYEHATDLVLPPGKADELANSRIEGFVQSLRKLFPGFDAYPAPAQHALVDMIYTLGPKGLEKKFPTVVASCRAGDFTTAAKFCHRKAQANEHRAGDVRNAVTRSQFLEAARLAGTVQMVKREIRL
jgi:GH24 family phage-related lysozyme (muramidase)